MNRDPSLLHYILGGVTFVAGSWWALWMYCAALKLLVGESP